MYKIDSYSQKGFSTIEILFAVLVIVIIGGAGYAVMQHNSKSSTTDNAITAQDAVPATAKITVDATKVGTTSGIDQLTTLDQQSENNVDSKYEATEKTDSVSAGTSLKNLGGAYDESSF